MKIYGVHIIRALLSRYSFYSDCNHASIAFQHTSIRMSPWEVMDNLHIYVEDIYMYVPRTTVKPCTTYDVCSASHHDDLANAATFEPTYIHPFLSLIVHSLSKPTILPIAMSKSPSLRRIQADVRELALDPSDRYHAAPLESDMFEWYVINSERYWVGQWSD